MAGKLSASTTTLRVTARGAARWAHGHPWIYRSDVVDHAGNTGVVRVVGPGRKFLGQALYSPRSEISLRLLEPTAQPIDTAWWSERLAGCLKRRRGIDSTAYRVVHGEGDGLPSLVVDLYDRWAVVQLLSAGVEAQREPILGALRTVLHLEGILLRNDAPVRRREGLPLETVLAYGQVPRLIEVREGTVRYYAAPWDGQKTGAFLDQRPNRLLAAELARPAGEALDCFTYHGSFALHLAPHSARVTALDASVEALARGEANARLNGLTNITWVEEDAFDALRRYERERRRFDTIVLDPPAFAKTKATLPQAIRGYKEINLRAMRLLSSSGILLTASCSFHFGRSAFLEMLAAAASDSGRRLTLTNLLTQGSDHPEILTIPETGYLKGAVVRAV